MSGFDLGVINVTISVLIAVKYWSRGHGLFYAYIVLFTGVFLTCIPALLILHWSGHGAQKPKILRWTDEFIKNYKYEIRRHKAQQRAKQRANNL